MNDRIRQSFSVPFTYPVCFTRGVFAPGNETLASVFEPTAEPGASARVLAFVDAGLAAAQPDFPLRLERWFAARAPRLDLVAAPVPVPGGEAVKNDYRLIMAALDQMLEYRLCRQSYVLVAGGGAVLDAVGFAAALVHRGLRLVRLPSTTLAQNDAGLGVKNGMNLHGQKNAIGVFAPPAAVVNDLDLLSSLPLAHWLGGVAEAFKVALIKDAAFFHQLCADAARYPAREPAAMEALVRRCAALHLDHIRTSGDPFEMGSARPLDCGHWAAHRLESLSGYRMPHGQAVAFGLALDAEYAAAQGWLAPVDCQRLLAGLETAGFSLWDAVLDDGPLAADHPLFEGLALFREHLGGQLTVTLPWPLGQRIEVHEMDRARLVAGLERLRARARGRAPAAAGAPVTV
ncbi:MAG: 3-dehydroquinate synthase [Candidatus Marinimicrobia bacterium]|nr:3-dehydroquinate synthase [Candidatus Neomarinimicrobiota bacterium]